jgi:hypothetical protein
MSFVSLQASKTNLRKGSSSITTATLSKQFLKYSNYQYISITEFLDVWLRIVKHLDSMYCDTEDKQSSLGQRKGVTCT